MLQEAHPTFSRSKYRMRLFYPLLTLRALNRFKLLAAVVPPGHPFSWRPTTLADIFADPLAWVWWSRLANPGQDRDILTVCCTTLVCVARTFCGGSDLRYCFGYINTNLHDFGEMAPQFHRLGSMVFLQNCSFNIGHSPTSTTGFLLFFPSL